LPREVNPSKFPGSGTEVMPVKDPHTRTKPMALARGHGRYMAVTPERRILFVVEWPLHTNDINLICNSETVT
jgi:hypothetical protein